MERANEQHFRLLLFFQFNYDFSSRFRYVLQPQALHHSVCLSRSAKTLSDLMATLVA